MIIQNGSQGFKVVNQSVIVLAIRRTAKLAEFLSEWMNHK